MQVAPAGLGSAHAEVVFLAVAFAEVLDVEQADVGQCGAADVHAETHAGGHVDHLAGVCAGAQRVQLGGGPAGGQVVVLAEARVAADGGVVGERGDAGHLLVAIGGGADAVEPVAGDLSVAVEQQHIVVGRQRHAAVDGADKAEVLIVLQQQQARIIGLRDEFAQPLGDSGFGAGIVDDHQAPGRAAGGCHDRLDAALRVFQAAINGDDEVHRVLGRGEGPWGGHRPGLWWPRGADTQQAIDTHLGMHEGAGGTKHGGVLDRVDELHGLVALTTERMGVDLQGLVALAQLFVLLQGGVVLFPGQLQFLLCGFQLFAEARVLVAPGLQPLRRTGQRQVVGGHGPAHVDLERAAARLLQGGAGDGQFDPGVIAMQQQQKTTGDQRRGL